MLLLKVIDLQIWGSHIRARIFFFLGGGRGWWFNSLVHARIGSKVPLHFRTQLWLPLALALGHVAKVRCFACRVGVAGNVIHENQCQH